MLYSFRYNAGLHMGRHPWTTLKVPRNAPKETKFCPPVGVEKLTFQLQGIAPLTRGSAPEPHWGLCSQTPVKGSRTALAMVRAPPLFLSKFTPMHAAATYRAYN